MKIYSSLALLFLLGACAMTPQELPMSAAAYGYCIPPTFNQELLQAPVLRVLRLDEYRSVVMHITADGLIAVGWERGEMMMVDLHPDNALASVYVRRTDAACAWDYKPIVGTI